MDQKTLSGCAFSLLRTDATTTQILLFVGAAFLVSQTVVPVAFAQQPLERIYLAADDHTDYFWTADDIAYRDAFIETLDYYLDLIDSTQQDPEAFQARWNCDGSLWLWEYERNKSPAAFERLVDRIRSGHISSPSTALASTYGAQPVEAVLRGMYYAGQLERQHDLRFTMAVAMENQTLPLGLGSLWSGAGVKYSWRGVCGCATKMPVAPMRSRDREIYWWKGPDGSRVLMKWNSLFNNNESIGGYAESRYPREAIKLVRNDKRFRANYPYQTIGIFGQGWDDLKTLSDEFPRVARELSDEQHQVIVSNEEDFFKQFEKQYGDALAEESLAYGNEWDLYCASMAEQTSRVRRAVEQLRAAEALAVLVSRHRPDFWDAFQQQRQQAHMDLGLYWEHDWTANANRQMAAKRANWQVKLANRISRYSTDLYRQAADELAMLISTEDQSNPERFYVFNPLGWHRTGSVDLLLSDSIEREIHIVDLATGEKVEFQRMRFEEQPGLRVLAKNIPSVGYHVFEIRDGAGMEFEPSATHSGFTIENDRLRVTATKTGAIRDLFDKTLQKELSGANGLNRLSGDPISDDPASVKIESTGPVSTTLRIDAANPLQHTTRITLRKHSEHVEIENVIQQNFQDVRTWQFDFALQQPETLHEEIGAVLKADLVENGGHYASRNARYDWLTLNHFMDMSGNTSNGRFGITLANIDCCFFQNGNSSPEFLDADTSSIKVLVGGQVDGSKLGIRRQHGGTRFTQRFALRAHTEGCDPVSAMRWSLEWQNPLVARMLKADPETEPPYPARTYSLLRNTSDLVLLWALKPAEEGIDSGMIARLWSLSDRPLESTLEISGLQSATATTHLETDREPLRIARDLSVPIEFSQRQMRSVRLHTGNVR